VIVQGIADLVVLSPRSIWLIDFKTDTFPEGELADRVGLYAPQLALYACALSRIYRRPVSECWLYFLTSRRQVPVELVGFGPAGVNPEPLKRRPRPSNQSRSL